MLQTFLQTFRKSILQKNEELFRFIPEKNAGINPVSGFFEKGHPNSLADFHFYHVNPGDYLKCSDDNYCYQIAYYMEEIENRLIYTYCYQEEENWAKYSGSFLTEDWIKGTYYFSRKGWIRLAVKRMDGAVVTTEHVRAVAEAFVLFKAKEQYQEKPYFRDEAELTAAAVKGKRKKNSLVVGLMADSHYVINGGWEDSIFNIRLVHKKVKFDAIFHLGDLTDGMVPIKITKEYAGMVKKDLAGLNIPVYFTLGNHDSNYFRGNPEWLSDRQQSEWYLEKETAWYHVDFDRQKLRCLFLYSFDHREKIRYGFPEAEVDWVAQVLENTPKAYQVLILSHVPLLPQMHFWSDQIKNGAEMKDIIDRYVRNGGTVMAYIHGHNHADQIFYTENFPIVAIGCAKCEDFKDKKPEGSITYDRKMGTVTQELWDVMVVDTEDEKIDFIRFGAGCDRSVQCVCRNRK